MQKRGISGLSSRQIKKLEKLGWPKEVIKKTVEYPQDQKSILKLERVGVKYNEKQILKEISLAIKDKEIFGIIGLAGSGKSTLLHVLVGLLEPTNGNVLLKIKETENEIPLYNKRTLANSLIGFSTQTTSFYPDLTVEENIEYFAALYGFRADTLNEVKESVFNLVPLKDSSHIKARNLSKGLQKKLDIACSLVHTPDILILDEPIADLDPVLCQELWSLIRRINNAGTTIILASHQLTDLEKVCDRIGILHKGNIAKIVNINALAHEPYEINLEIPHPRHFFKNMEEGTIFKKNQLTVRTKKPLLTAAKLIRQLKKSRGEHCLVNLTIKKPSLKKIFDEVVQT